jgi:hypothetical protein
MKPRNLEHPFFVVLLARLLDLYPMEFVPVGFAEDIERSAVCVPLLDSRGSEGRFPQARSFSSEYLSLGFLTEFSARLRRFQ